MMKRRFTSIIAMVAAVGSSVIGGAIVSPSPIDAAIVRSAARIECSGSTVRAYVPSDWGTQSSNAGSTLHVAHMLFRWNGNGWDAVDVSTWWARTTTDQRGYPGQISPFGRWLDTRNNIARFHPFRVGAGGHYAVLTYIYDSADRSVASVLNRVSAADPASAHFCTI